MTTSPNSEAGSAPEVPAADVIVIGSGFGGSVAACRLAQAGFSVLILERGRRFGPGDFPPLPERARLFPDTRRWLWGPELGLWDVQDLQEVVTVQAAGYGGGSLVYANVHLRPPEEVFDERWPVSYRNRAELDPYYDLAASMLEVAPISAGKKQLPKVRELGDVARKLGREAQHFHPPLAIRFHDGHNAHGVEQRACNDCGACCSGCPRNAKNTLDHNYLAVAERFKARSRTHAEVLRIARSDDGYVVTFMDHLEARERVARCRYLFVCAGVVHTTRLLAQLEHDTGHAHDSRVGTGYFPGGDAVGVVFDTKEPLEPSQGPAITTTTVHWQEPEKGRFFLVQDGGYAAELEQLIGMLRAPIWVGRNRLTQSSRPQSRSLLETSGANASLPKELSSMTDQLLDAVKSGDLAMIATPTLKRAFMAFFEELKEPLLLPELVEQTIESMLREKYAQSSWLSGDDNRLGKLLLNLERAFIRWRFGGGAQISKHVAAAVLGAGGLSRTQWAARLFGYANVRADRRLMLLAMGRDAAPGILHYDPKTKSQFADLDLFHLAPGYSEQEQVMADVAGALEGELRVNPAWSFLGKPITVHNQGGVPMSDEPELGVTDPEGQVRDFPGLYVMDASIFCTSVGVNPSATILAIAERNVLRFIRKHRPEGVAWPEGDSSDGALAYQADQRRARDWAAGAERAGWALEPPSPIRVAPRHETLGVRFKETMDGYCEPRPASAPRRDEDYLACDVRGRPDHPVSLQLEAHAKDLARFIEDQDHRMDLSGVLRWQFPGDAQISEHRVEGALKLFTPRRKAYGIEAEQVNRRRAQEHLAGAARYNTVVAGREPPSVLGNPDEQFMRYDLTFVDRPGYTVRGYKRLRDKPGIEGWRDVSCLFVRISDPQGGVLGAGAVRVDLIQFLREQLPSMQATGCDDPVRATWALGRFATFFFGSLQRVYFPELQSALSALFGVTTSSTPTSSRRPLSTNTASPGEFGA